MIQRYTKVDFSRNLINLLNGVYNVSNDNYEYELVISNNHIQVHGSVKTAGTFTAAIPFAVQPPLYKNVWYTFSAQNIVSEGESRGLTSLYCSQMNGSKYWGGRLPLIGSGVVDGVSVKSSIGFCDRYVADGGRYVPNTATAWSLYLYMVGSSTQELAFNLSFDLMLDLGHTATEFEPYDKTKSVYITRTMLLYPAVDLFPSTELFPVDPKYGLQIREEH